ncbi:MAG: hypothetical protein U0003_02900 [Vampirovibrionales bacterium]
MNVFCGFRRHCAYFFYAFRDREAIFDLFEDLTGARMMYNYFRFGGVNADMPVGWLTKSATSLTTFPSAFDEYEAIATKPHSSDRCLGVGLLLQRTALKYGVTGLSVAQPAG